MSKQTYMVMGFMPAPGGLSMGHVLESLSITKRGELHHADAAWSRTRSQGIEFSSPDRAEAVARLVREWGLCDVVDVVEASS